MTNIDPDMRRLWPAVVFVLLLFAVSAIVFARAQNVWVDETTQLSGMTLDPATLVAWLSGNAPQTFGVPDDRMPPVSYLLDHLGWLAWGGDVFATRLYHAAFAALGIVALMVALARRYGLRAALIGGLFLALSPKLVFYAVEIRAYPIFFAITCLEVAMLVRGDVAARTGRLAMFLLLELLSGYTHFFGIVASSALFVAVFVAAPDVRTAVRAVVGQLLVLLLWLGLTPFIMGANSISTGGEPVTPGITDLALYVARLFATSAQMVSLAGAALFLGGVGLLLLAALGGLVLRWRADGLAVRGDPRFGLLLALAAGLMVTMVAALVAAGFNPLAPHYSIWTLPVFAVLLAIAGHELLQAPAQAARLLGLAGLSALAVGAVWGMAGFLGRAEWFVHGPYRQLDALVAQAGPGAAVVHLGPNWGFGYFPLYWRHREALPQWRLSDDGTQLLRIGNGRGPESTPQPLAALDGYPALIVNRIDLRTFADLRAIADRREPLTAGTVAPLLAERCAQRTATAIHPGNWTLTSQVYRHCQPRQPQGTP